MQLKTTPTQLSSIFEIQPTKLLVKKSKIFSKTLDIYLLVWIKLLSIMSLIQWSLHISSILDSSIVSW